MGSVNKVILVGNLGRDAELRYTQSGTAMATMSIATTDGWNDKATGERREKTEWHRIVIWGKQAETLADYLRRGRQVYVEGSLETRQWEDKEGNKRYTTEVRSRRVVPLGGRGSDAGQDREFDGGAQPDDRHEQGAPASTQPGQGAAAQAKDSDKELDADEIPF